MALGLQTFSDLVTAQNLATYELGPAIDQVPEVPSSSAPQADPMDQDLIMSMFSDTEESRKRKRLVKGTKSSSKEVSASGLPPVPSEGKNEGLPPHEDVAPSASLPGLSKTHTRSEARTADKSGASVVAPPTHGMASEKGKKGGPLLRCPLCRAVVSCVT